MYLIILIIISHLLYTGWKLRKNLHILQLNSYRNKRYWQWIITNPAQAFNIRDFIFTYALIPLAMHGRDLAALVFIGSYLTAFFLRPINKEKKPLVFTARAIRLFVTSLIFSAAISSALLFGLWQKTDFYIAGALLALILLTFFTPLFLIACNTILLPIENLIARWYLNDAKKMLHSMPNLTVVGITGSFGKTTTKYFLYEILRKKFNTLSTPGSFNTPMGITKIVRAELKPTHEIFIAEMSAKQKGDIKELCELAKPKYGLLTAVGEQHLDTFGNLETIKDTKYELIESLPDDGTAFFNMDDDNCRELSTRSKKRSIYFGIDAEKLNYRARNIKLSGMGCEFEIVKNDAESVTVITKLLGKQNIYNILAAVAIAGELGVKLSDMVYPIHQLKPAPHRLELKHLNDSVIYIDDAFNSNPVGSKMALEVLAQIPGKRKIIVTPGMIELGEKEFELNRKFGEYIADVANYVILVGKKQAIAMQEGLNNKNYPASNCFVADDFNAANLHLQSILQAEDVVLFENDLPDNYN